jgi:DNA modification methylase
MLNATILVGNAVERLQTIGGGVAQTCITSPPYFGLRDYGHDGQIGLEGSVDDYVTALVAVFAEVRRVLADDGTLWLNLGDSYANAGGKTQPQRDTNGGFGGSPGTRNQPYANASGGFDRANTITGNIKSKDLLGIPWRVAFALQADGWYLRSEVIWHKPNPMPESVTDRPTKSHETIFLLSKQERYFYDAEAIKEPAVSKDDKRNGGGRHTYSGKRSENDGLVQQSFVTVTDTRNKRSVWTVTTKGYKGAHFATYPPELIEPCVLAGSREGDIVLDPFSGSGTTGEVALLNNRHYVGTELNPDYADMSVDRIGNAVGMLGQVTLERG